LNTLNTNNAVKESEVMTDDLSMMTKKANNHSISGNFFIISTITPSNNVLLKIYKSIIIH